MQFETSEEVQIISTFKEMGLREELLRGIFAYGKFYIHVQFRRNEILIMKCDVNKFIFCAVTVFIISYIFFYIYPNIDDAD